MLNTLTRLSILFLLAGTMSRAHAFSLLGPYAIAGGNVWQVLRLGYNEPGDIGGPMNVAAGEEYRWNTPNIFYAYDAPFLDFFGTRGVEEVEKAIKIINDLPPASALNVDDYPMTTERINFRAAALGLWDVKSSALAVTVEEMGLAAPPRWVYCLRNRGVPPSPQNPPPAFFNVIRRNFDPVTAAESPYINGRLWTYAAILDGIADSIPINQPVDPLDLGRFDPVAAYLDAFSGFSIGSYYSGLTRDDVGAIRYMLRPDNKNFEAALPGSTSAGFSIISGGGGGGPWTIPPSTNSPGATNIVGSTNGLIDPAVRFGVDKITFIRGEYDSLLGQFFTPITNVYVETIVTNGIQRSQKVQRVITTPDILYTARDLQGIPDVSPLIPGFAINERTDTSNWRNDDSLSGGTILHAGPGVIQGPIDIAFNSIGFMTFEGPIPGPVLGLNNLPYFLFAAFDGTTNEPVVFSQGGNITIQQLEQLALGR
ncbi:MAG TPA: hypothetical protein VN887_17905 [Candidatus Angelobacter sp.]|nr:hypothetical protein [Candidatus Angelobacter sp.]